MVNLSTSELITRLSNYRHRIFRYHPQDRVITPDDAISFVNQRGFIFFWPIKGIEFPSLWGAVAGNRPVPAQHDDPGHITWRWKDDLLGKKIWHYAKVLRKRSTIISLDMLPYFYALSSNYGSPMEDYLIQYQEGKLTILEKRIFELLIHAGAMDTINIRRRLNLTSKKDNYRFERALAALQSDFKIMPVGISTSGGWRYSFIYDLVHLQYPALIDTSRQISESQARIKVLQAYFMSVGGATIPDIKKLFQWRETDIVRTIDKMTNQGWLMKIATFGQNDILYLLPELFRN